MVELNPIIVIGPVGRERHILTSHNVLKMETGHGVAKYIINDQTRLGGSGYFATWALIKLSVNVRFITNVGNSEWISKKLAQESLNQIIFDEHVGCTSDFVSVWDKNTGSKQLFVKSATDPTTSTIKRNLAQPPSTIISLSLRNSETYMHIANDANEYGHKLFIVPNQTLLNQPRALKILMRTATGIFLNEAEAFCASRSNSVAGIQEWYQQIDSRSTLIVTHSGVKLSVLEPKCPVKSIILPRIDNVKYALGGGDVFAAIASAMWGTSISLAHIEKASLVATKLIGDLAPFK